MKPTLTNPTDDQLNAAFAEHVAGWKWQTLYCGPDGSERQSLCKPGDILADVHDECFTTSADAVLPWLVQCPYWAVDGGPNKPWMVLAGSGEAEASTFPRAALIALLRAHGVEVVFP